MKDLKFRAWDKKDKEYFGVDFIDFYNEVVAFIYHDLSKTEQSLERFDFDDIILEQYTGLEDENGVEIYEGDIVKDIHSTYEVQHMGQLLDYGYYEVIGNIHENKELLE